MNKLTKRIIASFTGVGVSTVLVVGGVLSLHQTAIAARDTFSNVAKVLTEDSDNVFTILEIVDDLEDSAIGYLVDGCEPIRNQTLSLDGSSYDMDNLTTLQVMTLQKKGLLALNASSEQSAYALRFAEDMKENITYSNVEHDETLLAKGYIEYGYYGRFEVVNLWDPAKSDKEQAVADCYIPVKDMPLDIGERIEALLAQVGDGVSYSFLDDISGNSMMGFDPNKLSAYGYNWVPAANTYNTPFMPTAEYDSLDAEDEIVFRYNYAEGAGDGQTPAGDGQTPAGDGQTPAGDGQTPAGGGEGSKSEDSPADISVYIYQKFENTKVVNNNLFANYVLGVDPSSVDIDVKSVLAKDVTLELIDKADFLYINLDGKRTVLSLNGSVIELGQENVVPEGYNPSDESGAQGIEVTWDLLGTNISKRIAERAQDKLDLLPILLNYNVGALDQKNYPQVSYLYGLLTESYTFGIAADFCSQNFYRVGYTADSFDVPVADYDVWDPIVNADLVSSFTKNYISECFSEVYSAILTENYERNQQGLSSSISESIDPALVLSYIIGFKYEDSIIYKTTLSVLELEPCRSFTYFADGLDVTTNEGKAEENRRKLEFVKTYAPQFEENLDAVSIYGMTTSTWCASHADLYEDYDIIYIGTNTEIMNHLKGVKAWKSDGTTPTKAFDIVEGPSMDVNQSIVWGGLNPSDHQWVWSGTRWECWTLGNWGQNGRERVAVDEERTAAGFSYYWFCDNDGKMTNGVTYQSTWDSILRANVIKAMDGTKWIWDPVQQKWLKPVEESDVTAYNDGDMIGCIYTHTGDTFSTNASTNDAVVSATYIDNQGHHRYSGNDILDSQVPELMNYLKSGSPIILAQNLVVKQLDETTGEYRYVANSSSFTNTVTGKRYSSESSASTLTQHGTLDNSSYMYEFVDQALNSEYYMKNLLVEGETADDLTVSKALNTQKIELNLYNMPTPYDYTSQVISSTKNWNNQPYQAIDEVTYLQKESDGKYYLNYEFSISNLAEVTPLSARYDVKLFIDANNDAIFSTTKEELTSITVTNPASGEVMTQTYGEMDPGSGVQVLHYNLEANTPYVVRRELPEGYAGSIYWRLKISQVGNEHIHDSVTGITAVQVTAQEGEDVDEATGKKIIHVLQVTPCVDSKQAMDLEFITEDTGMDWNDTNTAFGVFINNIPDFKVQFDRINYEDFVASFENETNPASVYYDARSSVHTGWLHGRNTTFADPDYIDKNGNTVSYVKNGIRSYKYNFYDYDMVIIGFTNEPDNLASKKATDALYDYAEMGKSILYTFRTLSVNDGLKNTLSADLSCFTTNEKSTSLTMAVRQQIGMDRYGITNNWLEAVTSGVSSLWTTGNPVRNNNTDATTIQNYNKANGRNGSDVAYATNSNRTKTVTQMDGLTPQVIANPGISTGYLWILDREVIQNKYGISDLIHSVGGEDTWNTNSAYISPTNKGSVTMYPYAIGSEEYDVTFDKNNELGSTKGDIEVSHGHGTYSTDIQVSNAYAQVYQLDLDTDEDKDGYGDVTVWYTISSRDTQDYSDAYDFLLNDARNDYYIYSKGNITFAAIGNSFMGMSENEMKLFVNVFVSAYNSGVHNPIVRIVDGPTVNANDLEYFSVVNNGANLEDQSYSMYYQVNDANVLIGTTAMDVEYYVTYTDALASKISSDMYTQILPVGSFDYQGSAVNTKLMKIDPEYYGKTTDTGNWETKNAATLAHVDVSNIYSGHTYRVEVPMALMEYLGGNVEIYVKINLRSSITGTVLASSTDRLILNQLELFDLD